MSPLKRLRHTHHDCWIGPGLAALVIVVFALGIGVDTVLFTIGLATSYLGTIGRSPKSSDV